MAEDEEQPHESSPLLPAARKLSSQSSASSHLGKEEQLPVESSAGERLPYNNYTTIDWLHDLVRVDAHTRP